MAITLHVEPRATYTWREFKSQKPPYSIALDGFVNAPTKRDAKGPYANFDHHSGADRTSTRSTSDQVHMEINLRLFEAYRKDGIPHAHVWVNDPDEDTCLSWWLLKHHEQVRDHATPRINRLVYIEDRLDATAGAYPFGDIEQRRKMAWIFDPYNRARFEGRVAEMDEAEMRNVMESVSARIDRHVFGDGGEELPLEGHYESIGGGNGWTMTRETGPSSRMAMYVDGVTAFAALVAQKEDGSSVYTLGRLSDWVNFNLGTLYARLNDEESSLVSDRNLWGGSTTIGGSPRGTGSRLSPEQLEEIINDELSQT